MKVLNHGLVVDGRTVLHWSVSHQNNGHYDSLTPHLDPRWSAPCPGECGQIHRGDDLAKTLSTVSHTVTGGGCDIDLCCGCCETYEYEVVDSYYCSLCLTPVCILFRRPIE